ncbi:MAG: transcriptional regulator [Pseudomonadota bacterium]|nr:transcriptional regulator [Pseudomonadota bacterium]
MKSAYDKIAAGLEDAIAYAGGDTTRARVANVDVAQIRAATGKSQPDFASTYGFSVRTVQEWEQGRRQPDGGSATLLRMIAADARAVEAILERI